MKMQIESHEFEISLSEPPTPAAAPVSRALVVEDDPVFAGALTRAVQALGDGWQALVCPSVADAMQALSEANADLRLALVDMNLPDGMGLEVIRALRVQRPDVPSMVVSSLASEEAVLSAIGQGARGYLHKSEPVGALSHAMGQVMQGHYPISPSLARYLFNQVRAESASPDATASGLLTPKETETLRCIAQGMSYAETADHMGVSLSTVQSHIRSLYRKLEVRSQVQAVGKAREKGLL